LDGVAGFHLEICKVVQAGAEKHRVGENHHGAHEQLRRSARIEGLELAGLDPVTQDQLGDVAERVLVIADRFPAVLDGSDDKLVDTVLGRQILG